MIRLKITCLQGHGMPNKIQGRSPGEPKVGDTIFTEDGTPVTEIGAIICHHPFKIFGRDGKKYIIRKDETKAIIQS